MCNRLSRLSIDVYTLFWLQMHCSLNIQCGPRYEHCNVTIQAGMPQAHQTSLHNCKVHNCMQSTYMSMDNTGTGQPGWWLFTYSMVLMSTLENIAQSCKVSQQVDLILVLSNTWCTWRMIQALTSLAILSILYMYTSWCCLATFTVLLCASLTSVHIA